MQFYIFDGDTKQAKKKYGLIFAIVLLLLKVIEMLTFDYQDRKAVDVNSVAGSIEHCVDKRVNIDSDVNYGIYVSYFEKNEDRQRDTDYGYVVGIGTNDDDFVYVGLLLPVKYDGDMAKRDSYYDEWTVLDPLSFTGIVERMDQEEQGYFEEYFKESGWTEQEISDYTMPYIINVSMVEREQASRKEKVTGSLFLLAILVAGFGISTIVRVNRTYMECVKNAGTTKREARADYNKAVLFGKKIRVGELFLHVRPAMLYPRVFQLKDVYWVYRDEDNDSDIVIWSETSGKVIISKEEPTVVYQFLEYASTHMPWVVVGTSQDLVDTHNKGIILFKRIKYDQEMLKLEEKQFYGA